MAIGSYISTLIGKLIKMDFPSYVGSMFVAVIVRNINEKLIHIILISHWLMV